MIPWTPLIFMKIIRNKEIIKSDAQQITANTFLHKMFYII